METIQGATILRDKTVLSGDHAMTTAQIRKRIAGQLRSLSGDRLQAAYHFIKYLNDDEDNPATVELLKISGFSSSLQRAERQAAAGKTVPFSKVRRDV
jgi:hypothetical protein